MLGVPAYTYEHILYSATSYSTSFSFDYLLALRICAQRKNSGLCFTPGPMTGGEFFAWLYVRRTHTSADPIGILCIRIALTLTLSRPSRFLPSARLMVGASPRALYGLCGTFRVIVYFGTREEEERATGGPTGGHRNYYNSIGHKSRGLETF